MVKCNGCGKKLGWFASTSLCDVEGCDKNYCSVCADKKLESCEACDGTFCVQHIKEHDCDNSATDEESSNDLSEIAEYEDKNKLFVIIDYTDRVDNDEGYIEDLNDLVGQYIFDGYIIQGYYPDANEVWLVKKNG